MRVQNNERNQANRLFIVICALLAIGLLIGTLQFAIRQSFQIALAQEDGTAETDETGEADDAEETADAEETDGAEETDETDGAEETDETDDAEEVEEAEGATAFFYLPLLSSFPPVPTIATTLPSKDNAWTVSWTVSDDSNVTEYILEESQDPNFTTVTSYTIAGGTNSQAISKSPSPDNSYYFRVRSVINGGLGDFSNVVVAHGAYYDDFSDDTTGWEKRRFTFLEETDVYYGSGNEDGNLVVITVDRWDWVLGSPFRHAPAVPYEIRYRMRVHDPSNLVSGGAVLGGDWNGGACPEVGNVYQTTNCFNHFYNFNMIFFGPMKLLFEQVNRLDYCPNCGGSQLKRLGPTTTVENISGLGNPATDWHNFRITVHEDGLRFYVDDKFVRHFTDTTHIHEPYFGVFTSTDEYKPSIYLFDHYAVTPLDN